MDGRLMSQIKLLFTKKKRLLCQGYDGRNDPGLVKLKIYKFQCKCLKSSLELTKIKIKIDAKGSKPCIKINPLRVSSFYDLYSTNYSDAFKYLIYRSNFVSQVNPQSVYRNGPKCGMFF
jgi:hypothetical protein